MITYKKIISLAIAIGLIVSLPAHAINGKELLSTIPKTCQPFFNTISGYSAQFYKTAIQENPITTVAFTVIGGIAISSLYFNYQLAQRNNKLKKEHQLNIKEIVDKNEALKKQYEAELFNFEQQQETETKRQIEDALTVLNEEILVHHAERPAERKERLKGETKYTGLSLAIQTFLDGQISRGITEYNTKMCKIEEDIQCKERRIKELTQYATDLENMPKILPAFSSLIFSKAIRDEKNIDVIKTRLMSEIKNDSETYKIWNTISTKDILEKQLAEIALEVDKKIAEEIAEACKKDNQNIRIERDSLESQFKTAQIALSEVKERERRLKKELENFKNN
jgi:hypothetical protein